MKKLLLAFGLAGLTLASAHAQGTFNPVNGPTSRVKFCVGDGLIRNAVQSDGIKIGVFIGAPDTDATTQVGTLTIGSVEGLMVGLPTLFSPSTSAVDTAPGARISLRFATVDHAGFGDSGSKTITLAPAAGPGTVVWGSTPTATRFGSLLVLQNLNCVPEPSTLALGGLAGALLLLRARKTFTRR